MIERRSNSRVYESHPALFVTDTYPSQREALTLDVSLGGLRIETPYDLKAGERLEVSINIPPQLIKCKGKVIHVLKLREQKAKVGVRFENLSNPHRLYLAKYISYVIEKRSEAGRGVIIGIAFSLLLWAAIIYAIIGFILR